MKVGDLQSIPSKYNHLVIRERVLVLLVLLSCVYFLWYMLLGLAAEQELSSAQKKREDMLSLSETIMSQYKNVSGKDEASKNIAIIDKRILSVKSKMDIIDEEIKKFNDETIDIDEIVLLLRDLLAANQQLTLESLKVHPSEVIKRENSIDGSLDGAFEKNMISLSLRGDYSNVFVYLKKIEALEWSVFWQDVRYMVESYPQAVVNIQLYTLSVIEENTLASR